MNTDTPEALLPQLDQALLLLEQRLDELTTPLMTMQGERIGLCSTDLQQALVDTSEIFQAAKRAGRVPPEIAQRLRDVFAQVIALREALNRMSASIDRALEALIPEHAPPVYSRYPAMPVASTGRFASYNA